MERFFKLGDEVFKLKEGIGPVQLAAVVNEGGEVRPGGWFEGLLLNLNPNKHWLP